MGHCLRHALNKLPDKLVGLAAPVRQGLRAQFHTVFHRCRQRTSLRVVALGQRLRRFADHIATTVGPAHGERVGGAGLLAPPALLMGWLIPPPWEPGGRRPAASLVLRVPLPGTTFINAANDVEFLEPIVEGDVLTVIEELVSVSPEKRTRLGVGHFVETLDTYRRQDGAVVARSRNTLFRFTPGGSA